MADENGNANYRVTGVKVTQQARLDTNGQPQTAFLVAFSVGVHGPFQIMFAPNQATPQNIRNAILAQVNALREQDNLIAQLNATV